MFSYGNKYRITLYGASHDKNIGIIIDGIKPGFKINFEKISESLKNRNPILIGTTPRKEVDELIICSGLFNGLTTGAPLNIMIENKDVVSKDYGNFFNHPRPNHADFVAKVKYGGYSDYRGGGFFSGRMTALLVIAGEIANQLLPYRIESRIEKIGNLTDLTKLDEYLKMIKDANDSVGGIVKVTIKDVEIGMGDPYFNKLDAAISHLIMTVPGVRGIVFGDNFDVTSKGSINNDLILNENGLTKTNHSGGIVGGISNGNDIVFNVYVKPTSSILKEQETYNFTSKKVEPLLIEGRHDSAFIRRILVVLEATTAIVLANFIKVE